MKLTEAVSRYLAEVKLARAPATLRIYSVNLEKLISFAEMRRWPALEKIKADHLVVFFCEMDREQKTPSISSFARYGHFLIGASSGVSFALPR